MIDSKKSETTFRRLLREVDELSLHHAEYLDCSPPMLFCAGQVEQVIMGMARYALIRGDLGPHTMLERKVEVLLCAREKRREGWHADHL